MSWSAFSLTQGQIDAVAYGASMLVGSSMCRDGLLTAEWHSGDISAGGGTPQVDRTDPDAPISSVYDGKLFVASKPTNQSVSTYYLYLTFSVGQVFDVVFLRPGTFVSATHITVERADDALMQTNKTTVCSWTNVAGGQRLLKLSLGTGNQWFSAGSGGTNVLRISFQNVAANFDPPEINEVVFGRRRQLNRRLSAPYDPNAVASEGKDFVTAGRSRERYIYASGFQDLQGRYNPTDDGLFNQDDQNNIRQAFVESGYGRHPVLWIEDPSTAPGTLPAGVLFGLQPMEHEMPLDSHNIRDWQFNFSEEPPFLSAE